MSFDPIHKDDETGLFFVIDRLERKALRDRKCVLTAEIKALRVTKKVFQDAKDASKSLLNEAKKNEVEIKKNSEKPEREVVHRVERVLKKHRIDKPYYHGGEYNGKAMNRLMTDSASIMRDLKEMLLEIPEEERCSDAEVIEVTSKFADVLKVWDAVFSIARVPSGRITAENVALLRQLIPEALRLWKELGLGVLPKPHAVEDHLRLQVEQKRGIGDVGEDFVEQEHQTGIKDDGKTRNAPNKAEQAKWCCNWEHKRKHPEVLMQIDKLKDRSVKGKYVGDGNSSLFIPTVARSDERRITESKTKKNIRVSALAIASSYTLKSGHQRNLDEAEERMRWEKEN